METVEVYGIVMIVLGVLFLGFDFLAYAKKKLTEEFGLIWLFFAVLLVASGILFLVLEQALVIVLPVFAVFFVFIIYGISKAVSVLEMKNQELAMQVSLLNQENERILQELEQMRERDQDEQ